MGFYCFLILFLSGPFLRALYDYSDGFESIMDLIIRWRTGALQQHLVTLKLKIKKKKCMFLFQDLFYILCIFYCFYSSFFSFLFIVFIFRHLVFLLWTRTPPNGQQELKCWKDFKRTPPLDQINMASISFNQKCRSVAIRAECKSRERQKRGLVT